MNKKIFFYILCSLLIITTTACGNNQEENAILSLCNQIESDITSYQNNQITRDDLYSKLENYNNSCPDPMNSICITIKSILSLPKEREDLQEEYAKEILNLCNQ